MDAQDFFGVMNRYTLKPFIEKPNEQMKYINLMWNNCHILFLKEMLIDEQSYIVIVLRAASNNNQYSYENELTNLLNRRALQEQWVSFVEVEKTMNIALLLVDLDCFKKFNESLGKQTADNVLAMISKRFRILFAGHCKVFRYNGDEFVFILQYTSYEEVKVLASQIIRLLKEPLVVDNQDYYVSSSVNCRQYLSKTI